MKLIHPQTRKGTIQQRNGFESNADSCVASSSLRATRARETQQSLFENEKVFLSIFGFFSRFLWEIVFAFHVAIAEPNGKGTLINANNGLCGFWCDSSTDTHTHTHGSTNVPIQMNVGRKMAKRHLILWIFLLFDCMSSLENALTKK